ncbi:hypothetical protein CMK12_14710 [Candidatus Poribacteria bacterium]|nr:hypothetical protein [Candidatus Poribacteria bacterium]
MFFEFGIIILGFFCSVTIADLKEELIGHWKFDEGSGDQVKDISGKDHHGKVVDGKIKWVDGKEKKAIYSNQVDIQIDDHPDFHLEKAVSISLWTKPDGAQANWAKFFIKQKSRKYPYSLQYNDGQAIFATVHADARFDTIPKLPTFKEWAHLCFTYGGERKVIVLYKDGKEGARTKASGKLKQNDLPVSIGGRLGSNQDLKGSIDEIMLYNRAVTPEEIKAISKGGNFLSVTATANKLPVTWSRLKVRRLLQLRQD